MKTRLHIITLKITVAFAIPLGIVMILLFKNIITGAKLERVDERFTSLKMEADTKCEEVESMVSELQDFHDDFSHYCSCLKYHFELIDKRPFTYGAVFDNNEKLITGREVTEGSTYFNPYSYPAIVESICKNRSDTLTVNHTLFRNGKETSVPFLLFFRRVPNSEPDGLIVMVGLTHTPEEAEVSQYLFLILFYSFLLFYVSSVGAVFFVSHLTLTNLQKNKTPLGIK